jgi:hypothetical protein
MKTMLWRWILMGALLMSVLAGCSSMPGVRAGHEADLQLEAAIGMIEAGSFEARLGVRNASEAAFAGDKRFNGHMELRYAETGELRASANLVPLHSLEPGELVQPLTWQGELEPGGYILVWGAEGYGETKIRFAIYERGGMLYLGGDGPAPEFPGGDDGTAMPDLYVAQAVADLAARGRVRESDVTVVDVRRTEFPDASLGMPEPDMMYAQVITPGYIIELALEDAVYTYHAAGERVVLVPPAISGAGQGGSGPTSQQVTVIPEIGLSFAVQEGWQRLEPEVAWTPVGEDGVRLGVNWIELVPPMEPEVVLMPNHAEILDSEPIDLGWAQGRRTTLEVFAPAAEQGGRAPVVAVETHVLLTLTQGGRRLGLDFYLSAPTVELLHVHEQALEDLVSSATLTPSAGSLLPLPDQVPADWQTLTVEGSGGADWRFQLSFPMDWVSREANAKVGGGPEDWPVVLQRQFYPLAWVERLEKQSAPAPNAPPTYIPLLLEVVAGPEAQLRRVYVPPTQSETLEVNELTVVREVEGDYTTMAPIRYVIQHPERPEVWIVLTDMISGFSSRVDGNEAVAEVIPLIVATLIVEE